MAFLRVTRGGTSIDLDVEIESATESEPETIGSMARAFDGSFRGDLEEFRTWHFVALLTTEDRATLRNIVKNRAQCQIDGDAFGVETIVGVVELGDSPYMEDALQAEGFRRVTALTVREDVAEG